MFFTEEKLQRRIDELAIYRYREAIDIQEFAVQEDLVGEPGASIPNDGWGQTISVGERWSGRDKYLWLKTTVEIPDVWAHRKVVGLFDFGRTGGGNNSGFESLLYINGQLYQGVDSNHKEVLLPPINPVNPDDPTPMLFRVHLTVRLWSGLEGGGPQRMQEHTLSQAQVAWLDEQTDDLYFTARAILQTVGVLDETQPTRSSLLQTLNRAFAEIDWSYPGSDDFYTSVHHANELLQSEIAAMDKQHSVTVHAIGHTHIDVAWLWRLRHTREKAARSWSTVMRLMDQFPEYRFLQTQPQLYDYLKSDYPQLYEQIRQRIAHGEWEAAGAMWLEADCNISSGESLVRQLLSGIRFFQSEFDVECRYLWLPDVFGYSWALPQILKLAGIEAFVTTKISWNEYNRMPHDTFWWRGIDGSEILTHSITTPEEGPSPYYTYNGVLSAKTVQGIWNEYKDKGVNRDLLLSYGYGDGGGGVNREMLEMRRRLDKIPGIPQVRTSTVRDYLEQLMNTVRTTDEYVHTWDGELYLEYHRGTYTSQAYVKKMNRRLELLLRETEWLAVYASLLHRDWGIYPSTDLHEAWKIVLRNQFHDIIPGSSIHEVYEDARLEYTEAEKIVLDARSRMESAIARGMVPDANNMAIQQSITYQVSNSSPWSLEETVVFIPSAEGTMAGAGANVRADASTDASAGGVSEDWIRIHGTWKDSSDGLLQAEPIAGGWLVKLRDIRPMSIAAIWFEASNDAPVRGGSHSTDDDSLVVASSVSASSVSASSVFVWNVNGVETPFYVLAWNNEGQLVRIYDKEARREVLAPGLRGNVLQVFEDKPVRFDAWNVDIFYQEKMREITDCKIEVVESGLLRAVVEFRWKYLNSTLVQRMVLYGDTKRIDFKTRVDWHERQQLLKVAFPVDVRCTEATYDIQFGNVKRPTHWNTSWDYAKFETVAHQWADLSEEGYGVSLLNDCKYGYDIKDNVMRLSLLKSAIYPDVSADEGVHEFTYSLYPHIGRWAEAGTVQEAWLLNSPIGVTKVETGGYNQASVSVGTVSVEAVAGEAVAGEAVAGEAVAGEAVAGEPLNGVLPARSLFRLSSDNIMIDAVKRSEDGTKVVLRVHEFTGRRGQLTISSDMSIRSWQPCNLLEHPVGELVVEPEIQCHVKPYEICTFLVDMEW